MKNTSSLNILLVDPSAQIQNTLPTQLQSVGIQVTCTSSAEEALVMLSSRAVDIIILETVLPGMQGIELLKLLRAMGNLTLVLILSAQDAMEDRIASLNAGGDDFLSKPFHVAELVSRLNAISRGL